MSPPGTSTPQRFLTSTLASYWSLGIRMLVTFGARMILARLLLDDDFGRYEVALRIVTIAAAVRDLGISFHLVRDERRPYGTALAFGLLCGLGVTLALVFGAPLVIGDKPELLSLVQVFSVWVLLEGLVNIPRTYFERELAIGRLVAPEIARGLLLAVVSVALAKAGWGAWSLVIADLTGAALFAAFVWWRAWGKIPLKLEWHLLPELLRRGRLLFLIWMAYQLVLYLDIFVLEGLTDEATVGQYGRAYFLAFLVRQVVFPRALLSALLDFRHEPERFALAFRTGIVFLLFCEVTAGYFLFFNSAKVVAIVLGPGWEPAETLLRILCIVPFLDAFSELGGSMLKVLHEDRLWLTITLINLVSLAGFGIWFTLRWGAIGMALANFLLLGNLVMAWRMRRLFGDHFRKLMGEMLVVYLVPGALLGVTAWLLPAGSWSRFGGSVMATLLAVGTGWLVFRPLFKAFFAARQEAT